MVALDGQSENDSNDFQVNKFQSTQLPCWELIFADIGRPMIMWLALESAMTIIIHLECCDNGNSSIEEMFSSSCHKLSKTQETHKLFKRCKWFFDRCDKKSHAKRNRKKTHKVYHDKWKSFSKIENDMWKMALPRSAMMYGPFGYHSQKHAELCGSWDLVTHMQWQNPLNFFFSRHSGWIKMTVQNLRKKIVYAQN